MTDGELHELVIHSYTAVLFDNAGGGGARANEPDSIRRVLEAV